MATLHETPGSNRLHIGIFGKTNSGKSSFINAFTGQDVSIVADVAGTTTDLVSKAMEISMLGACVLMDTAGFDDESSLGAKRVEKTRLAAEKTDIAVILISAVLTSGTGETDGAGNWNLQDKVTVDNENKFDKLFAEELQWFDYFQQKKTPVLFVINKADIQPESQGLLSYLQRKTGETALCVSAKTKDGMEQVKEALARKIPKDFDSRTITGNLVMEEDVVLLVMPQDIQAPKGRLILPQVQTLRELLDKKCIVMSTTTDKFKLALTSLKEPPKLIITDSQVFDIVYEQKPKESMLTSFSVLFAAWKGDLPYYVEGAKAIDSLTEQSKVLIAECCTHAPLQEDIGSVKIPRMLRKRFGEKLSVTMVSGTDFPEDLSNYDLIIQCGGCMFNRKYVLSRIDRAKAQKIPMTNYGITIAHLGGILDKVSMP